MIDPSCPSAVQHYAPSTIIVVTFHVITGRNRCVSNYEDVQKMDLHFIRLQICELVEWLVDRCQHFCEPETWLVDDRYEAFSAGIPMSKDCFAIPREASLPAKFPYIPSIANPINLKE
jgi:hypothetical protein